MPIVTAISTCWNPSPIHPSSSTHQLWSLRGFVSLSSLTFLKREMNLVFLTANCRALNNIIYAKSLTMVNKVGTPYKSTVSSHHPSKSRSTSTLTMKTSWVPLTCCLSSLSEATALLGVSQVFLPEYKGEWNCVFFGYSLTQRKEHRSWGRSGRPWLWTWKPDSVTYQPCGKLINVSVSQFLHPRKGHLNRLTWTACIK